MTITLNRDDAIRMFKKIGATIEDGGRHLKIALVVEGKLVFKTVLSHGSKEIPTGTAKSIFREIGVSADRDICISLRNCPMTRAEYVRYITGTGLLR